MKRLAVAPTTVRTRRWAVFGAVLGLLLAVVVYAPAAWLASALAGATGQRLLLTDTRGSVWSGSARVVLSPGPGAAEASELPERLSWTLRPGWIDGGVGVRLTLAQLCCVRPDAPITARFGWKRLALRLPDSSPDQPWIRWPAAWLTGLGTPWNTLAPDGQLVLSGTQFLVETGGAAPSGTGPGPSPAWRVSGALQLELREFSSRLSPIAPLGSYRLALLGAPTPQLLLQTQQGPLQLSGQGSLGARVRFMGEATAAPGNEAGLANLLNIIGRRDGARSIISVG